MKILVGDDWLDISTEHPRYCFGCEFQSDFQIDCGAFCKLFNIVLSIEDNYGVDVIRCQKCMDSEVKCSTSSKE